MENPAGRHHSGFSLVETLVVITILALITMAAGITLRSREVPVEHLAHAVAASAREARSLAIVGGTDAVLLIDTADRRVWIAEQRGARTIPESVAVEVVVADVEKTSATRGGIRFFPDGSSSGGTVTVSRGHDSATVSVDWMTGRATARAGK